MFDKKNHFNTTNSINPEQTMAPTFNVAIGAKSEYSIYPSNIILYTIEEHLKQFRDDIQYKVLYDCWQVEKKIYENRLKNVSASYETYSLHDASHSETILRQIEFFLGEQRIRQLTPTDAWLILECAYCHDLGMVITAEKLFVKLSSMKNKEFEEVSKAMQNSQNTDVQMAWNYLSPLFEYGDSYRKNKYSDLEFGNDEKLKNVANLMSIFESPWYEWPMYFTQAFMIIIQEYCRPKHAEMSYEMIIDEADKKTYEGLISRRLRFLIAEISAIHTDYRGNVVKKLKQVVQGHYTDYAHPRFVAELIRIGDLLDIDNNRFNEYQMAVSGNPSYNAFTHILKHKSVGDFLITPEVIEIKADFKTKDAKVLLKEYSIQKIFNKDGNLDEDMLQEKAKELMLRGFKALSGWLEMLREELEFFSINWLSIVPKGLVGGCPIFKPEELLIDGEKIDPDILDLKYHITARRASQIIEGSGLYDDVFEAFIREIIQNAMDATKRRIYADLKKRHRNAIYKDPYKFYKHIAKDLNQIIITVSCMEKDDAVKLIIRDNGIGITHMRLKCMQHIGNAFDRETHEQAKEMPLWWKPTGSFGIGMQTIFYFTKSFTLTTRTEEDGVLRKMKFYSTQAGGKIDTYSLGGVTRDKDFGYGTCIEINIPKMTLQMFQKKGYQGFNDYFASELLLSENIIRDIMLKVCGSFGIPVRESLSDEDEDGQANIFLRKCFGKYYFNFDEPDKITDVTPETDISDEFEFQGFSCWNAKKNILIRYRRANKMASRMKTYFNEILVNDEKLCSMIHIPFFETEVYFFDYKAEDYLEINRDSFLAEKRQHLAESIGETNLEFIKFLLKLPENSDEYKYVWDGNYSTAKSYLEFVICKKKLMLSNNGIKLFIQNDNFITYLMDSTMFEIYGCQAQQVEMWLTDTRYKYAGCVRLSGNNSSVRIIVEDLMYDYTDISVSEIACMRDIYGDYFLIYKTSEPSGMPINISEESFDFYIMKQFRDANVKGNMNRRIILPGIDAYKILCVNKLVDNIGTSFEKRLNSAIISPMVVENFMELLKENDEQSLILKVEDILPISNVKTDKQKPPKEIIAYDKILNYIEDHRINSKLEFCKDDINQMYKKLIIHIWNVLKENMPNLNKS